MVINMSISIILLLTMLAVVLIDVLLGVFRGASFSLLRLVFHALGSFIAAILAKSVAIDIIMAVAGNSGHAGISLNSTVAKALSLSVEDEFVQTLSAPISGLSLSFAVPLVFVGLFIVFKFISWLLYFILKMIIKHIAKKAVKRREAEQQASEIAAVQAAEQSVAEEGMYGINQYVYYSNAYEAAPAHDESRTDAFVQQPVIPVTDGDVKDANNALAAADTEFALAQTYVNELPAEYENQPQPTAEPYNNQMQQAAVQYDNTVTQAVIKYDNTVQPTAEPYNNYVQQAAIQYDNTVTQAVIKYDNIVQPTAEPYNNQMQQAAVHYNNQTQQAMPGYEQNAAFNSMNTDNPAGESAVGKKVKKSWAEFFTRKPWWSRLIGGLIGFGTAVFTFAIILMPVRCLVFAIDGDVFEAGTHILQVMDDYSIDELVDNVKSADEGRKLRTDSEISSIDKDAEDLLSAYASIKGCAAFKVCKFLGAEALTDYMYAEMSTVTAEDIEAKKSSVLTYNFANSVNGLLRVVPNADKVITQAQKGDGITVDLVDSFENLVNSLLNIDRDGALFSRKDKLAIANYAIDEINKGFIDLLAEEDILIDEKLTLVNRVESNADLKSRIKSVFDLLRAIVEIKEDFEALVGEFEEAEFNVENVENACSVIAENADNMEPIIDTVNSMIYEMTDEEVEKCLSYSFADCVKDPAKREEIAYIIEDLCMYLDRDFEDLTVYEKNQISEEIGRIYELGAVDYELYEYALKYFRD
ncbi:MAG: hypothetical protein MJ131_04825 [Lachnospiraceae bacterium]|nr:hypothetical protein [Lachnospiraceae bacterium]